MSEKLTVGNIFSDVTKTPVGAGDGDTWIPNDYHVGYNEGYEKARTTLLAKLDSQDMITNVGISIAISYGDNVEYRDMAKAAIQTIKNSL